MPRGVPACAPVCPRSPLPTSATLCAPVSPLKLGSLSTGLGLFHIAMVAQLCGMQAQLWQQDDTVVFRLELETRARDEAEPYSPSSSASSACPFPPKIRVLVLDDSAVARKWVTSVLKDVLPEGATILAYGEGFDDVDRFTRAVGDHTDIVIVDQHLDFLGADVLGTSVVQELVTTGYRGLVCMRTANATGADVAAYRSSGAHCVIGKEMRPKEMVALLSREYWSHVRSQQQQHQLSLSLLSHRDLPREVSDRDSLV